MKFRKRPVVIKAEQFSSLRSAVPAGLCDCAIIGNERPHVHTIHNNQVVIVEDGDWIIPEPDGIHFYPCKPDIFEATYEPVEE